MTSRSRIALYSHDTVGLGHTRRNLALATALTAADPSTDVIMITGNPECALLPIPPRTDIVTLPTIAKDAAGYRPRVLGGELDEVLAIRSDVITGALKGFRPQLLIADKVADGVHGELLPGLQLVRQRFGTRTVLGLREILDAPAVVRREWQRNHTGRLIADHYDEVWIYGDRAVIDPAAEYGWGAEMATKVSYTGYLGHRPRLPQRGLIDVAPPASPYVLCQVGGGQDGVELATAFAGAELPPGHRGVIVTGPYLPAESRDRLRRIAGPNTDVHDFVGNPEDLIAGAAAVVSMAGYNSVTELLSSPAPTLLVPRVVPRTEQLIRAERLADLECADLLHPALLTRQRISTWLAGAVHAPTPAGRAVLDLNGLDRVGEFADRLIGGTEHAA